jgi:hypothetical protein
MEVIVKDEDRRQLLKAHNDLRNMITTIHECSDVWLSDIGKLEHLQHMLHHALKFTAPVDGEGNKMWWRDYVYEEEVPSDE